MYEAVEAAVPVAADRALSSAPAGARARAVVAGDAALVDVERRSCATDARHGVAAVPSTRTRRRPAPRARGAAGRAAGPPMRRPSETTRHEPPLPRGRFERGGRRQVSWLPGLPLPRLPGPSCEPQWLRSRRARADGFTPVTVAGPRRIRTGFPSPPTNGRRQCSVGDSHDGQPHAHLHAPRRRRRDAPRRHEPRAQDAPADRGLRRRRRAQRAHRRRARAPRAARRATREWLRRVQNDLFDVGADLSVPHGRRARAPARARRAGDVAGGRPATRSTRRSSR